MMMKKNFIRNFYNKISPTHNRSTQTSNIYEDVLNYPRVLMRIFGIYHEKTDQISIKIYCIFVLLLEWFMFCKTFTVFKKDETFSGELVLKIVTLLWMFIVAFNGSLLFTNQEMISKEQTLKIHFLECFNFSKNISRVKNNIYLKINLTFMIALCFGIFNLISAIVSLFGPSSFYPAFSNFLSPFQNIDSGPVLIIYKIVMIIIIGYFSLFWTLVIGYFLSHSIIMVELLKDFNESFINIIKNRIFTSNPSYNNKEIDTNNNKDDSSATINRIYLCSNETRCFGTEEEFDFHRLWHLKLCQCINQLDNCYKLFIAFTVTFYTCIVLLILYTMSDWNGNCIRGLMEILYPFWGSVGSFLMCLIILFTARINTQVIYSRHLNFIEY